jgi:beta-phosphoglucomutase-like phosphatase (HAD superfamily)
MPTTRCSPPSPRPSTSLHACAQLGIEPAQGLAVEDSGSGATSAVRAGCPTVGTAAFLPSADRAGRRAQLVQAGVLCVVDSWRELTELVVPTGGARTAARAARPAGKRRPSPRAVRYS